MLVPGGPIENRDFSHMTGLSFGGFNIFLITLGIASFITSYYLMIGNELALMIALVLGVLYFSVYLLDLFGIFPKSPTPMSKTLMLMEIVNALLSIYLIMIILTQVSL